MPQTAPEVIIAVLACLVLPCARAGEAGADPLEGPTTVTVQTYRGERYTERLVPGEWLDRVTSTDRGSSLRFPYASGSHVRFDYDEPYMYIHVDGGPRRLAGVEVRRRGEMEFLRRALADQANPLTVWYDPTPEEPFPAIPADVKVALMVVFGKHAKWDELLAACPHLWALSVGGEPPPPQVLARLNRLSSLRLHVFNAVLSDLSWAAGMSNLRVLHLEGPLEVTDLRPLSGLRKLQALTLTACPGLSDLGPLRHMPQLAKMSLRLSGYSKLPANKALTDLSPLADVPNLEELRLEGLSGLRDLGPLANLRRLQTLELAVPIGLSDLKPLGQCTGLRTLRVSGVKASDLAPLASLSELRHLEIYAPQSFGDTIPDDDITLIGGLKRLESLRLSAPVEDLGPLAKLANLTQMELAYCHNVKDLKPVGTLPALTDLSLKSCGQVADLAPLGNLASLKSLRLDSLGRVTDLAPLARLTALEDLRIWFCGGITDIRPLAKMSGLNTLEFLGCNKLSDLSPLAGLKRLRSLWLVACAGVSDLRPLAFLPSLERVSISNCERVKDISPLRPMLRRGGKVMHNKDLDQEVERLRGKWDF
jgi:Leucine-rich repeat (LRR) protein